MKISANTRLVCVIGNPIGHSLSPAMQNAAFHALSLDYCYLAFDVRTHGLQAAMEGLRALGAVGCNVTIPHKQSMRPFLDGLDPDAGIVGAVNTLARVGPGWFGYNTDVVGFLTALGSVYRRDLTGASVIVLGAGGAARAVCVGLGRARAGRVTLIGRSADRVGSLIEAIQPHFVDTQYLAAEWMGEHLGAVMNDADLLVNTTPLGMDAQDGDAEWTSAIACFRGLRIQELPQAALVYDLIYCPETTPLMAFAIDQGLQVENGLGMLVHQGAESFRIWTKHDPPLEEMRRAALAAQRCH